MNEKTILSTIIIAILAGATIASTMLYRKNHSSGCKKGRVGI